ncbi:MAG: EAL domain-containing protein [Methyloprofundus sp.]|nr:EAL domain-containing protein [Methyloprofundus sp.]
MKKLFYPAIVIMNKLSFTWKIMLLGGIYLIALAVVIYSIYVQQNEDIYKARHELNGVVLIKPVLKTIQSAQRHRGLSSGVLGGDKGLSDELGEEVLVLKNAFQTLETYLPANVISSQSWRDIILEYQQIQSTGLNWTKDANFFAHIHLIAELQKLMITLADKHALTFDPEIASYYLILTTIKDMPLALEQLGQMRAYGMGILANKEVSEQEQIKMHILLTTLASAFDSLAVNLDKISQFNEQIRVKLLLAAEDISVSSKKVTQLVQADILTKQFVTDPEAFFDISTAAINSGYTQIYQTLLPTLERLLHARIEQAEEELLISIGSAFLLALVAQYLFFGIYYASIGNIKLLARSAYKYTQGDLQQRVHLNTKDDIKQIGDSFNDMADSFNQLLATHLEDKERLQTILNTALDAIIQVNAQGIIISWSQQAETMFGWSKTEAEGQAMQLLIIPERYRKLQLKGMGKFIGTGKERLVNTRFEIQALNRAGVEFPVELSISPVKTAKGLEFSAFIRDLSERKEVESSLRKLSLAVEQSPSSIIITDSDANIEYANQAFLKATGYKIDEVIGENFKVFNIKAVQKEANDEMWEYLSNGNIWQGELSNQRKDGSEYIESVLISPVRQESGEITHYLAIKEDITEKKQAEIESGIAAIAFEAQEGIMVTDAEKRILRVNKAFTKITGYSSDEVIGEKPNILSSGRQGKKFYSDMWATIARTGSWQGELLNQHKRGCIYPEWLTITARKDKNKKTTHYVGIFTDITKFKAAEEKIKHLAFYDPLTQLANRRKLIDRLEHGVAMCLREGSNLAILMLDLDRFKIVNDNFGHQAGDELLQQVGSRINKRLRKTDLLARLGGDEFVVLLEDISHADDAARVAEEIISELARPFQLNKAKEVRIGTSIGISLYPEHADSIASLMDYADMALYQAKDRGRGCYAYFSEELTRTVRENLELEANLRRAIKQQELRVYYQPQVDIVTGQIIGAEALVRWHPEGKDLIPPNKFIPIAEETGLIIEIGEWVLQETCRQGDEWLKKGLPPIILAVNVAAQQFKRSNNMYAVVKKVLAITGFPANQLELEMTESSLMEQPDSVVEILNELRSLGLLLAIDDFGTGYSSLAYLKNFPLDTLKIDKSFIDDIPHDPGDVEIAKTINAMGHTLGFKVLAEGVENQEQLDFLRNIGCHSYQGYIKSKALPADEFEDLLRAKHD